MTRAPVNHPAKVDFTALRHPVLAVACSRCHARAGSWCKRPSGHRASDLHVSRKAEADRIWEIQGDPPIRRTATGWTYAYGKAEDAPPPAAPGNSPCSGRARGDDERCLPLSGRRRLALSVLPARLGLPSQAIQQVDEVVRIVEIEAGLRHPVHPRHLAGRGVEHRPARVIGAHVVGGHHRPSMA